MLRVLSLCSGIGGFDLAAEWAGMQVVGQVEIDPFCQSVLKKHWPHVKLLSNLFEVKGDEFGTVDVVVGGIPCQPFSTAGKRRGNADDRALWPEVFRIIKRARPVYAVIENVPGFISLALNGVLLDLENSGYTSRPIVIPACAVGAPHRRERLFIVAYSPPRQSNGRERGKLDQEAAGGQGSHSPAFPGGEDVAYSPSRHGHLQFPRLWPELNGSGEDAGYPASEGLPDWAGGTMGQPSPLTEFERPGGREIERYFRGVDDGFSFRVVRNRVSKFKALGNALVPAQCYPILKAIAEWDREAHGVPPHDNIPVYATSDHDWNLNVCNFLSEFYYGDFSHHPEFLTFNFRIK